MEQPQPTAPAAPFQSAAGPARSTDEQGARAAVLRFVQTPLSVRWKVVKLWRPLPEGLWTELSTPHDRALARRCERRAMVGVALMAAMLLIGFSGVGLRAVVGHDDRCFPLLGRSVAVLTEGLPGPGWYYMPGQSLSLAGWVVVPSLAGWMFVRMLWIPVVTSCQPTAGATLTLLRHLGSVYLLVYLMILVGLGLMLLLLLRSPQGTETFRGCLWCFLFGESFFVPAVMWSRLVVHDSTGLVFGRYRYALLAVYLMLFVVIPLGGMIQYLD